MKLDAQRKIAELESRIAALEDAMKREGRLHYTYVAETQSGMFGEHWKRMWEEFNLAMREAFGSKP